MDAVKRSKEIFEQEISELQKLSNKIGEEMNAVVEMIYACKGKILYTHLSFFLRECINGKVCSNRNVVRDIRRFAYP